jgi:streptogramin lyase
MPMSNDGFFDVPTPPEADAADADLLAVQERLRGEGAIWRERPLMLAPLLGQLHALAAEGRADHPPIALQEEMTFMATSSVTLPVVAHRRRWVLVPVAATVLLATLSIGFFAIFAHRAPTASISFTSSTVVATPVVTTVRGFQRYATGPYDIDTLVTGPDGAIWFAARRTMSATETQAVAGRITSTGQLTIFPVLPAQQAPMYSYYSHSLVVGADGNLWFVLWSSIDQRNQLSATSHIVRVTTSGQVTLFTPPAITSNAAAPMIYSLTAGPDGALWFTANDAPYSGAAGDYRLGRITTAGVITYRAVPASLRAVDITAGPDGALWFSVDNAIERMTLQGAFTAYPITGAPSSLRFTPDGVLWFEMGGRKSDQTYLGQLDRVHHSIMYLKLPANQNLLPLAVGSDGHIWFTTEARFTAEVHDRHLCTVASDGALTEVMLPDGNISGQLTAGPDGNLWFADFTIASQGAVTNYIAHITPAGS